jgi:Methyltransferase domain
MLGFPVREFLRDPIQYWMTARDHSAAKYEETRPPCRCVPDHDWEERMHAYLGLSWPCQEVAEFWSLWPTVMKELEAMGIRPGPESFQWWNDGDAGLVRAAWCLTRHLKAKKVVETGVAHGVTSRLVLEALRANGAGHLWSIDLQPNDTHWRTQVGAAVGDGHSDRWSYIQGSSRRRLPGLLSRLGQIHFFIHDSLHSERNVRFELDQAWAAMGEIGALLVDDVDVNGGFQSFIRAHPGLHAMIAEAEPLHPDLRRFNKKGLFGVILKLPTSHA